MYPEGIVVDPRYFDVPPETTETYGKQNPGMRPNHPFGKPDRERVLKQWARMVSALRRKLGIKLHFIEPDPVLFDMMFACDPGLWINDFFIASNFSVPRQDEVEHFKTWFKEKGGEVIELPPAAKFEGGDCVVIPSKKTVVIGYGDTRTNREGITEVKKILGPRGIKVFPVQRIMPAIYHLNSAFTVFPSVDLVAYYASAFEPALEDILRRDIRIDSLALTTRVLFRHHPDFGGEWRYGYTLNQIEQNGVSLMPWCHPELAEYLEEYGISVLVPHDGSSEIERSAGSYRCCVNLHNIV